MLSWHVASKRLTVLKMVTTFFADIKLAILGFW
jgi:hypothetical protein